MSIPLVMTERHLGDNPGVFLDVPYSGLIVELPFTVTWIDESASEVALLVLTRDVETWGGWIGHPVHLNGTEIGRVKDSNNSSGAKEATKVVLKVSDFPGDFEKGARNRIGISLEKRESQPGLLDDFVLEGFQSENFSGRLGW